LAGRAGAARRFSAPQFRLLYENIGGMPIFWPMPGELPAGLKILLPVYKSFGGAPARRAGAACAAIAASPARRTFMLPAGEPV
jgi:hypothetical protein